MKDPVFQQLLASVILDNKYDRFVKNRKTGKLDTNSLYKINHSNKLFKKKEARKNKDYSVSLVVDCSGSMRGDRIQIAAESAQKLHHHLCRIGVPNNVVVFNAGVYELQPFGIKENKNIKKLVLQEVYYPRYYFWAESKKYNVKSINTGDELQKFLGETLPNDERSYRVLANELNVKGIKYHTNTGTSFNSDSEALRVSREFLLKQKGKKVMIFLSDGQPALAYPYLESPIHPTTSQHDYNLKHEVDVTINLGIELYSIGIENSAVLKFYPKKRTKVISDAQELYPNIIELVKKNLKRG